MRPTVASASATLESKRRRHVKRSSRVTRAHARAHPPKGMAATKRPALSQRSENSCRQALDCTWTHAHHAITAAGLLANADTPHSVPCRGLVRHRAAAGPFVLCTRWRGSLGISTPLHSKRQWHNDTALSLRTARGRMLIALLVRGRTCVRCTVPTAAGRCKVASRSPAACTR